MSRYTLTRSKYLSTKDLADLSERLARPTTRLFDKTLIEFYLATGARADEALKVSKDDLFDTDEGCSVFIRGNKNSFDREIPLSRELFDEAVKLLEASIDDRVFPIGTRNAERIWHLHRPCKKPLHSTRHTFAVLLYEKTKDIVLVQKAMGHVNIRNTMIYVDAVDCQDRLRAALISK
jgi:integrase